MNASALSGKRRLTMLEQSPLDQQDSPCATPEPPPVTIRHWVPSRFNVRATADDGRLILWNTLSGGMAVFKAQDVSAITALLKAGGFEAEPTGLTGYLVDKGFLIKKGTDEYRKFLHAFGKEHFRTDRLEFILLASEDCNFRCTYCYEKFARGTMRPQVRAGIKRLVEKRIQQLSILNCSWFGGEPLYGWGAIEDLGPFFADIAKRHGVMFNADMTTNGYLLTPDIADKLFEWNIRGFQITLDGAPENHDCSRPTRDGQGTFATIFENLRSLAKRRDPFGVRLRVNFSPENAPGMERFMDMLQKEFRGDSRFRLGFHAVGRWGGDNDDNLSVCTGDESKKLIEAMKALAFQRGLGMFTLREANYLGGQVCYAARPYNFVVGATGKVMKCTVALDTMESNIVGQIDESGTLVLNDENMALWTEPAFARDEQCQRCIALPSCQGISCPLPRIQSSERPCVPTRTHSKDELRDVLRYGALVSKTAGAPKVA